MTEAKVFQLTAGCACGRVLLGLVGPPIVAVVCYCDDCQEGARRIKSLPDAPPVRDPDDGTRNLAYCKDRLELAAGREYLRPYKLRAHRRPAALSPLAVIRPCTWASTTASTG